MCKKWSKNISQLTCSSSLASAPTMMMTKWLWCSDANYEFMGSILAAAAVLQWVKSSKSLRVLRFKAQIKELYIVTIISKIPFCCLSQTLYYKETLKLTNQSCRWGHRCTTCHHFTHSHYLAQVKKKRATDCLTANRLHYDITGYTEKPPVPWAVWWKPQRAQHTCAATDSCILKRHPIIRSIQHTKWQELLPPFSFKPRQLVIKSIMYTHACCYRNRAPCKPLGTDAIPHKWHKSKQAEQMRQHPLLCILLLLCCSSRASAYYFFSVG